MKALGRSRDGVSEWLQRGSLRRRQEPESAARLAGLDIRLAADLDHASA